MYYAFLFHEYSKKQSNLNQNLNSWLKQQKRNEKTEKE